MTLTVALKCVAIQLVIIAIAILIFNHYSAWTGVAIVAISLAYWVRKTALYLDAVAEENRQKAINQSKERK
jgi:4-hydroxybenzoate polyprenyltransferase